MSNSMTLLPQVSRVTDLESHTDDKSVCLEESGEGKNSIKPKNFKAKILNHKQLQVTTYNIRTMKSDQHFRN